MSNRDTHLAHPPRPQDETPAPLHSGQALTLQKVRPYAGETIVVTSEGISVEGWIEQVFSHAGDDVSPPLSWSPVELAQGYALVVEDPDAPREEPPIHWMIWDIPPQTTSLPRGVVNAARPVTPQQAVQGKNVNGDFGWAGPKPPPGHGVHHYHFQLFAQAKRLEMGPETTLAELTDALRGNTVASGELIGMFETKPSNGEE